MPLEVIIIPVGAFLAAFVTSAAGFGDALVLGAVWFHFLDPIEAVPLIVANGVVMQLQPLYKLHSVLVYDRLPPFLIAGVLGVPLGAWLLANTAPDPFRFGTGVFLITYCLFVFLKPQKSAFQWGGKIADAGIGFTGGILGGFAGLSGVTPTLWAGLRGWSKARQRGVFQPFIFAMHILSVAWLGWKGLVTVDTGIRLLWSLPAIFIGGWAGLKVYHLLDEQRFRQFVLALLIVSGVTLVL